MVLAHLVGGRGGGVWGFVVVEVVCCVSWSRELQMGSSPLWEEEAVPALLLKVSLLRQGRKLQKPVGAAAKSEGDKVLSALRA